MYNIYKHKPKTGKAKKAWEKFVEEFGFPPSEITYSPSYYGNKGWVCEFFGENRILDGDNPRGHGRSGSYRFYQSSEL